MIRPLGAGDAAEFRRLRLAALRDTPEAFGATFHEDAAVPLEEWAARLARGAVGDDVVFGAFHEPGTLVGTAGLRRDGGGKTRHRAFLWGMYVAPEARGRGLGRALLHAALAHARTLDGVERVILRVVPENTAARKLYAAAGFTEYGREPAAYRHENRAWDAVLMTLSLTGLPLVRSEPGVSAGGGFLRRLASAFTAPREPALHLAPLSSNARGRDELLASLADAITWCRHHADPLRPQSCLRSERLRPRILSNDAFHAVGTVVANRRSALGYRKLQPPPESTEQGRLLVYYPDADTEDGAAEAETDGFFDISSAPPWDTWVAFAHEEGREASFARYLVAFIPPAMLGHAARGLEVSCDQSIVWLDESDVALRGLLTG